MMDDYDEIDEFFQITTTGIENLEINYMVGTYDFDFEYEYVEDEYDYE